jgi:hypothetical protein
MYKLLTLSVATSLLVGCGGGGDSGSSTPTARQQVSVTGSARDLTKYAGIWTSACGITFNTGARSGIGRYQFAPAPTNSSVVTGTITITGYTGSNCTGTSTSVSANMTATLVNSTATVTTRSGSSVDYSGTMDQMTVLERRVGAISNTAPYTIFYGFSNGFTVLHTESTPALSDSDLTLRK